MIYSFKNDYSEGAHKIILEALLKNNLQQENGYGLDSYCSEARDIIREKIKNIDTDIHFVCGGTQANIILISSILKPYESIICAQTGHINTNETGAIEATGHKINTVETKDGKLKVEDIKLVLDKHSNEHMVKPRLVFISNTTELGTIYKKQELKEISEFCRNNQLYLYLDGARLGSALTSRENDLSLEDLASLTDAFYIGGTKNGALLGEAIVIKDKNIKEDFRYNIKQKGALLAKGRVLGIQFIELFRDNLYFELAEHANLMAYKISDELERLGCEFLTKPVSNQVFVILKNSTIQMLSEKYDFNIECKINDNESAIRLVTSWATQPEAVEQFIYDFKQIYI